MVASAFDRELQRTLSEVDPAFQAARRQYRKEVKAARAIGEQYYGTDRPEQIQSLYERYLRPGLEGAPIAAPTEAARMLGSRYANLMAQGQAAREQAAEGFRGRAGELSRYLTEKQQQAEQQSAQFMEDAARKAQAELRQRGLSAAAESVDTGYEAGDQQLQARMMEQAVREQMGYFPAWSGEALQAQEQALSGALGTAEATFGMQHYPVDVQLAAAQANQELRDKYLKLGLQYQGLLQGNPAGWAALRAQAEQTAMQEALKRLGIRRETALGRGLIDLAEYSGAQRAAAAAFRPTGYWKIVGGGRGTGADMGAAAGSPYASAAGAQPFGEFAISALRLPENFITSGGKPAPKGSSIGQPIF